MNDPREPRPGSDRPSSDEMSGDDTIDPNPDEVARGREALHELGSEPLPADVLARLEGRLERELGRRAPVRRRRRLPRLALALPGAGVALAAAVVVAVLATNGGSGRPAQHESALTLQAKAAAPQAPRASAGSATGGAAADSSASKTFALQVRVPSLVGHGMGYVRSTTSASKLKWAFFAGNQCPPVPGVRVKKQAPRAGTVVPAGSTVQISIGTCIRYDAG